MDPQLFLSRTNKKPTKKLLGNIRDMPYRNKPFGGIWTSTYIETEDKLKSAWMKWCASERFNIQPMQMYLIDISPSARIAEINCYEDLAMIIKYYSTKHLRATSNPPEPSILDKEYIDFELLSKDFDVLHLSEEGVWDTSDTIFSRGFNSPDLYGWDCESSLIMNWVIDSSKLIGTAWEDNSSLV